MQNTNEIQTSLGMKIKKEIINLIYPNLFTTIPLLATISSMLVFKLNGHVQKTHLIAWLVAFLSVVTCQGLLGIWFNKTKEDSRWDYLHFKLLIVDVGLIGILWGIAGVLFMPQDIIGQSCVIFVIAFVAGGGLLYLAESYTASAVFVTGTLLPLAASVSFSFFSKANHEVYFNLLLGLGCYWLFLMILGYYGSRMFSDNLKAHLTNQVLSEDLSYANEQLRKVQSGPHLEEEKFFLSQPELSKPKIMSSGQKLTDALTCVDMHEISEIKYIQSRAYARRHHQTLAVLFIHINNYDEVKSTYGEIIANQLLKTVAIRLQYCRRETDILSRFDENQFVLVVSEILFGHEVLTVVNKILKAFAEKTLIENSKVQIKANIGISVYPKEGDDLSQLISKAEIACKMLPMEGAGFQIYNSETMGMAKKSFSKT